MADGDDTDMVFVYTHDALHPPTPVDSRAPSPSFIRSSSYDPKPEPASSVTSACARLLLNEEFSDFKIKVEGMTWPAHKAVVCSQSEFFKVALRGDFLEAQEGTIAIPDETAKNIYRLLRYLYTGDYHDFPTHWYDEESNVEAIQEFRELDRSPLFDMMDWSEIRYSSRSNLAMYRLADKYGIPGLARLACDKLYFAVRNLGTVDDIAIIAHDVYSATDKKDDPLRKVVREVMFDGPLITDWREMDGCEAMMCLIRDHGDFALELVLKLLKEREHC
ncbi:POZ domain-containing protein [Ascobolus immersus RN42]|uniref:POZ domain-containing protein n=1 Tax=Ascobolus immersus RN42 TaxID=1160509 RepID=A0A3N4HHG2_ASCIM|nr:POZ domain-containing protein [Ascobolus immersus RN42]